MSPPHSHTLFSAAHTHITPDLKLSSSGVLSVKIGKDVRYESGHFWLMVKVHDAGVTTVSPSPGASTSDGLSNAAKIRIFVKNRNDNPDLGGIQVFDVTESVTGSTTSVFSSSSLNSFAGWTAEAGRVARLDKDILEGVPNEKLSWRVKGTNVLQISSEGVLSLKPNKVLDFESDVTETFKVLVRDNSNKWVKQNNMRLCVVDLNDAPKWESIPDKGSLYEIGPGSLSWSLALPFSDADMVPGVNAHSSCGGSTRVVDTHVFSVVGECPLYFPDSSVNIIKLNPAKSLDYETEPTVTCTFRVTDVTSKSNGAKSADRTETFTVLDYNEAPDVLWPFVTLYEDNFCGGGYVDLPRTTDDVCLGALMLTKPVASDNIAASGMVK